MTERTSDRESASPSEGEPDEELPAVLASFAQERLWFLQAYEPTSIAYNISTSLRLTGSVEPGHLERAFQAVIRRHEVLRTSFTLEGDELLQVIHPEATFQLVRVDLRSLTPEAREARLQALRDETCRRPFDLESLPLMRATLAQIDEDDSVLHVTMHHIVSDGWSLGIMIRELIAGYVAIANGAEPALPDLPIQYADYASWQRERLSGAGLEEHLSYWRQKLTSAPRLSFPTDDLAAAARGGEVQITIPSDVASGLRSLSRLEKATMTMTLLAGFKVLLSRLCGQEDVVVGAPIAGRTRSETEGLIGCFLNVLPLRTDLSGAPSFREVVRRVRETALDGYSHQELPFERMVDELALERELDRPVLFDILFNLLNVPSSSLSAPGLTLEVLEGEEPAPKFLLTLYLREEDEVFIRCVYRADLLSRARVRAVLEQLEYLLRQAVEDPDRPISSYMLRTPAQSQVLPDPSMSLVSAACETLPERVMRIAAAHPERVACADGDATFTYADLSRASVQIAATLEASGVGREDVVAVLAGRSASLAAALLGVHRAGAAFCILDDSYPAGRLERYIELAKPRAIVRLEAARLPEGLEPALRRVPLQITTPRHPPAALEVRCDAALPRDDDLAYVMFTSGSTGTPKAVAGTHASLSHFFAWYAEAFALNPNDRFAMLSGLAHDPILRDVFAPLWVGASVHAPPARYLADSIDRLGPWLATTGVTVAHLTPALAGAIAQSATSAVESLRLVAFGGDVLSRAVVESVRHLAPRCELVSFYGATETPQAMGWWRIERDGANGLPARIPLGTGIPQVQLLVLDRDRACGVGEIGEICVRTPFLARGYLGAPEGPSAFVMNPYGAVAADRIYRTGDLGRYRPDGAVEIVGRADDQVKIRGFRVELAEVESALSGLPTVRTAAVLAHEHGPGDQRLVAYVVPSVLTGGIDPAMLRAALAQRLPHYMIPSGFVVVERLPLTPNGKVDRTALPRPDLATTEEDHVRPRTYVEETLARIVAEVLGLAQVNVAQSFFELGGHSLLATQVVSRVRTMLEAELPLRALFEAPTVAGLAVRVEEALREGRGLQLPPLMPVARDGELPLSFGQERLWFLDELEPGGAGYNLPGALRIRGALDVASFEAALVEVVRRHEVLRTSFETVDGRPRAVVHEGLRFVLSRADLSGLEDDERERRVATLAEDEARRPFDLTRAPLLRATLLRLSSSEHVLLFTLHHIVSDGWSMGVLVREVASLYTSRAAGAPLVLPALAFQYADYAAWQRSWLAGEVLESQLGYWRGKLAGASPLELPTDRPRPPVKSYTAGATISVILDPAVTQRLRALSREEGATLFMTLLAAFQVLLARFSGQDDVVVGSAIANRMQRELEDLVGLFINLLALRTNLGGRPTFRTLLARVKETCLEAYAHQDVPFERVVDEAHPERDLARTPLFQVMFILQNAPRATVPAGALTLEPVELRAASSRFDLTLTLDEVDDGGIHGNLAYDTQLFDRATVEAMMDSFAVLLDELVERPDETVARLPLLRAAERAALVAIDHDTSRAFSTKCVHQLFHDQAARTPEAVAIEHGGERLRYGEVKRRAGLLAGRLRAAGVTKEVPVAVCVERSAELVIALLAVLEAGGAYIPLDPAYPADRIAYVLDDSDAHVLLSQASLLAALPSSQRVTLLVDRDEGESVVAPVHDDASSLAYVIYTSGSTGRPKGVQIEHRSLVNFLESMAESPGFSADDVLVSVTTISFDIAGLEVFLPLIRGGKLVMASREESVDGSLLSDLIERSGATVMQATPSTWRMLLEAGFPRANVRVLCGGEALPPSLADELDGKASELWNLYGPTETTIWSSVEQVHERDVTLGRAIANTQLHVIDGELEPVPVGVPGELLIGGVGLARGYLRRPGLTAERFVPDPFAVEPGARLYRTGDRVRGRGDRRIDFLGRLDHQIKLRGFRIELGEIEEALRVASTIDEVVVMAREDAPGQKRLVAYLVAAAGTRVPSPERLGEALALRLPSYMVPSAFVVLERMPLTPSGKIDRKALPPPDYTQHQHDYVAPHGEPEETLAAIVAELLQLERVGAADNFFEIGGDSIISVQLVARAQRAGWRVKVRDIFQHPTVAALALLATPTHEGGQGEAVEAAAPLTPSQLALLSPLCADVRPGSHVSLVELPGAVDSTLLLRALEAVVAHHDELRARFHHDGKAWSRRVIEAEVPCLEVVDLGTVPLEQRAGLIDELAARARASLHVAIGPLVRWLLFHLGGDEPPRLLTVVHQLVADRRSLCLIAEDTWTAYVQSLEGRPVALPRKTTSYRRWAERVAAMARSGEAEGELDYWRRHLDEVVSLPVDHESGDAMSAASERLSVSLSETETKALVDGAPRVSSAGVEALLVAALSRALSRFTASAVVSLELEGRGRDYLSDDGDWSRTVGAFAVLHPTKIILDDMVDEPGELLHRVAEAIGRVPHGGIGYGVLRHLCPEMMGDLAERPSPGVVFRYVGSTVTGRSALRSACPGGGRGTCPDGPSAHLLEVEAQLDGRILQVSFGYSRARHERATVAALAEDFVETLRALITHCTGELDDILGQIELYDDD